MSPLQLKIWNVFEKLIPRFPYTRYPLFSRKDFPSLRQIYVHGFAEKNSQFWICSLFCLFCTNACVNEIVILWKLRSIPSNELKKERRPPNSVRAKPIKVR
jgi:hypothetical protein